MNLYALSKAENTIQDVEQFQLWFGKRSQDRNVVHLRFFCSPSFFGEAGACDLSGPEFFLRLLEQHFRRVVLQRF